MQDIQGKPGKIRQKQQGQQEIAAPQRCSENGSGHIACQQDRRRECIKEGVQGKDDKGAAGRRQEIRQQADRDAGAGHGQMDAAGNVAANQVTHGPAFINASQQQQVIGCGHG